MLDQERDNLFATVEEALEDVRAGRPVIIVDDEERENEGDLMIAAEKASPERINYLLRHARGFLCVPMTGERLAELDLHPMVQLNTEWQGTDFTVTVDARQGTTSGVSVSDRARTIEVLLDARTKPSDLRRPGHVHPLRAREGGVLHRAGHTEAAVDLARLAGLYPAGVICEMMRDDGEMARLPDLQAFAREHGVKVVTIDSIIAHRRRTERLVRRAVETRLPTRHGEFRVYGYESLVDDQLYLALVMGEIRQQDAVLVRCHSQCLTGDVFGSLRCDCGAQLEAAITRIQQAGAGVVLYISNQEGRGIGLLNKLRAYALQDEGKDTVEANQELGFAADLRDYGIGAQVLADLGVRRMKLMTNNPRKMVGLEGHGLEVVERVPLQVCPTHANERYLRTKQEKLGHLLEEVLGEPRE